MVEVAPDFFAVKGVFADYRGFDEAVYDLRISAKPVAGDAFVRVYLQQGLGGFALGAGMAVTVGVAFGIGNGFEANGLYLGDFHASSF